MGWARGGATRAQHEHGGLLPDCAQLLLNRLCCHATPSPPSQVIEKAYKKLRLDALVIQQGRLVENTKSVNKEDLLSMVRPGWVVVLCCECCATPGGAVWPLWFNTLCWHMGGVVRMHYHLSTRSTASG